MGRHSWIAFGVCGAVVLGVQGCDVEDGYVSMGGDAGASEAGASGDNSTGGSSQSGEDIVCGDHGTLIAQRLDELSKRTERSCTSDSDCVVASNDTVCNHGCGVGVNLAGLAAWDEGVAEIERTVCEAGCRESDLLPPCLGVAPFCDRGSCSIRIPSNTDTCESFEDETSSEITIRISNETAEPIFLGPTESGLCSSGDLPAFEIVDPSSRPRKTELSLCEWTCEDEQDGIGGCPPACLTTHVLRIDPGGSFDSVWSGVFFDRVEMPAACHFEPDQSANRECLKATAAPAGLYRVRAQGWSDVECDDGADCECPDDAGAGSCLLASGRKVMGTSRLVTVEHTYPTPDLVEIRFE